MIGRLHGVLIEKQLPLLLVDVHGVGYEVAVPMPAFYELPTVGETLTLHTHLVVREDAHVLYGFHSTAQRAFFRALIKVNGIGPKVALAILSGIEPPEFARCVRDNDTQSLVRLPGVGKKTAERLLIEMRDKLSEWAPASTVVMAAPKANSGVDDAVHALIALGYKPVDASRMVSRVVEEAVTSEDMIRLALQGVMG